MSAIMSGTTELSAESQIAELRAKVAMLQAQVERVAAPVNRNGGKRRPT